MRVVEIYSVKEGDKEIAERQTRALAEVYKVVKAIKVTKGMRPNHRLFVPELIHHAFKKEFYELGWNNVRLGCEYATHYYVEGYKVRATNRGGYRELDFVKGKLGVEIEFEKPMLGVCSVCAKMTIFRNLGFINGGVEIVPVKAFADEMSTGVSYFEQFVWDLESRGVADIDVPVLILGIDI